jgi:signal transduction histidine kinase
MKIKSQFYLLVDGIVLIPVFAFTGIGIYFRFFSTFGEYYRKYKDEFEELLRQSKLAGIPEPPAFMRFLPLIIMLIIISFVIAMSVRIIRSITKSVAMLEDSTRRIANGELDLAVDVAGSNEITSLANSLNKMRNALKEEEKRRYLFIMGITHDLKTPLALIKANVEAVEDGIADNPEDQKHFLNVIDNKVDELEGMINSLLDFVRMDSAEAVRNVVEADLGAFLLSFIERITIDAELLHHNIESNINLPAFLTVKMNTHLIQRALDNIVNNFFLYTPEGSCLFLDTEFSGHLVKLNMTDNGNGIQQKDLPYIFDFFYRGSASRGEQGMGMGLAVAKSIFDSHGWQISLINNRDQTGREGNRKGACFRITIPITEQDGKKETKTV